MVSGFISRLVILVFGTLYPAYASYKAVRTKNVKEYVKWMMYWIVFALFTCAETFTDLFLSFWFPFYYELKIITVIYLLSPATKGSSLLYRKFVHPVLIKKEQEIDEYIARAKEQGYHTVLSLGSKGVSYATSLLMHTAIKGGGGLVNQLRKSYSLGDLNEEEHLRNEKAFSDKVDGQCMEDPRIVRRNPVHSPHRSFSTGSPTDMYFPEVDVYQRPGGYFYSSGVPSAEEISSGYSSGDVYYPPGHLPKGDLIRTASLGPSSRLRPRSGAKNGLPKRSSVSEGGSTLSALEPHESQIETDNNFRYPLTHSSFSFPFSPFIRPEHQYMFGNFPQNQFFTFMGRSSMINENFEGVLKSPKQGAVISDIYYDSGGQSLEINDVQKPDKKEFTKEEKSKAQSSCDQKDIAEGDSSEDHKSETESHKLVTDSESLERSGKYNKKPAPAPPSSDDFGCASENDEAEFCTPNASPKPERKLFNDSSAEKNTDEQRTRSQNQLTVPKNSKNRKSGISKKLHMPKMTFSFWRQRGGKHFSESESSSTASSENVSAKTDVSSNLDVFIPLRDSENDS